ncbi:MAG: PhoH family protein [Actinomycetota bacterium]|jgi:phosphate starvation-inducible PhoH-like protein|nr:PhoH family protein [Actinomycetota bacterium]MCL6093365.1 PhoH family protein [Actinomycetota bacterium]MDA8167965.1 PhoH family protein [Actinomycetota bacterium]
MRTTLEYENTIVAELAGEHDATLKQLEDRLPCDIGIRGNVITLQGDDAGVERGRAVIEELVELIAAGHEINGETVASVGSMMAEDGGAGRPSEIYSEVVWEHRGRRIVPKTINQKKYIDSIRGHSITFGIGPAGTGKTYLALAMAVSELLSKKVNRIILTRPAVEAGEKIGFLPGTMLEKVDPYLRPLFDALYDMIEPDRLTSLMEKGAIEVAPLAFMRGRTLNDSFIILDEAQNTSPEQMKMFLTRLGFASRMVVTGDITQVDLPDIRFSGLATVVDILGEVADIAFINFESKDVVRHKLVQKIVAAYKNYSGMQR